MKNMRLSLIVLSACCAVSSMAGGGKNQECAQGREVPFNASWLFMKPQDASITPKVDDHSWRKVSIPHDYSIESPFSVPEDTSKDKKTKRNMDELGLFLGNKSTGYLPGGTGWYMKKFTLPASCEGKKIEILFDGVNVESDVWVNGEHLGFHPYGYTAFHYDMTPYLKYGSDENVIMVRCNNKLKSRWYPGSGIYRSVKLIVTDKVRIPVWGVYVTTPDVSEEQAVVAVQTTLENIKSTDASVSLVTEILDPNGELIATTTSKQALGKKSETSVEQSLKVVNPPLWSVENPSICTVVSRLEMDGKVIDECRTPIGIRSIKFDSEKGFFLNGKYTKLKGACVHHDNGILGAKAYTWSEERRVLLLKELGYNAIRCAHNPPSSEFLDMCDKHGMLVIDEAFDEWQRGKAGGYAPFFDKYWRSDITSMVERDRNHPSIIMWSIGNEIPDQGFPEGVQLAANLTALCHELDPTRPTTIALQPGGKAWGNHFPSPEFMQEIDVIGYNYESACRKRGGDFVKNHEEFPDRIMYQSESMMKNTFRDWTKIDALENILGDFVWTGIDYIGETGIGRDKDDQKVFPGYTSLCGDYDLCGFRKPRSYYKEIILTKKPIVYATVRRINTKNEKWKITSWGWQASQSSWTLKQEEGSPQTVDVYSGCEEVELFLNNKSLGRKPTSAQTEYIATWENVPYNPGELKAVGYNGGEKVSEYVLKTADAPFALKMTSDRKEIVADGDVVYITAEVLDKKGVAIMDSDLEIEFVVTGPAEVAGVGSSSPYAPVDYPFTGNKCKFYNGKALLVLRSLDQTGVVHVTLKSPSLKSAEIEINVVEKR